MHGTARRRRTHSQVKIAEATRLLKMGLPVRQVASEVKMPISTVSDLRQRLVDEAAAGVKSSGTSA